jgi:hypothetical protein
MHEVSVLTHRIGKDRTESIDKAKRPNDGPESASTKYPDRTPIREHRFPVTYSKFPVPFSREFDEKAQAESGVFVA